MNGLGLKTKGPVVALATALALTLFSSSASFSQRNNDDQMDALNARIDWLEQSLIELQSAEGNYGGTPLNMAGSYDSQEEDPAITRVLTRLDDLENQIRSLTNQLEQTTFRIEQANRDLQSLSKDAEFRLRALELGGGSAGQGAQQGMPPVRSAPMPQSTPEEQSLGTIPVDPVTGNYQEDYDGALSHLRRGEHENAENALRLFLDNHSDSDLAGNAQYWLGESYYVREMWRPAAQSFLICVQKYKSGLKAPDCMLKLGMSLGAMGEKAKACKTFSEISRRFPDASQTIQQRARSERQRSGCT